MKRENANFKISILKFKFKLLLGLLVLVSSMSGSSFAQATFFFDEARPLALGGAYTGLAGDASALFYNPAGLAQLRMSIASLSGSYQSYRWPGTPGRFDQYGGTVLLAKPNAGIGVSLMKRGDSKDKVWRYRAPGDSTGPFSLLNQEMVFVVGVSQPLSDGGAIGLAGRYLRTTAPVCPGASGKGPSSASPEPTPAAAAARARRRRVIRPQRASRGASVRVLGRAGLPHIPVVPRRPHRGSAARLRPRSRPPC